MPRIVHGPSNEVKNIRIVHERQTTPTSYVGHAFKGVRVADTVTQAELEEHLKVARQEVRQTALAEAERRMQAPVAAAVQNVENALDEVSRFRRELFKEAEDEILEVIRAIAKKVVVKELQIQPDALKAIVLEALKVIEQQKKVVVQINPSAFEMFEKAKPDFLAKLRNLQELEFVTNVDMPEHTAQLNTKTTTLDVNLEAMVEQLMGQIKHDPTQSSEVNDAGDQVE